MAALDPLEQLRAQALDPVAADAPADLLTFAVEIGVEEGVAERRASSGRRSRSRHQTRSPSSAITAARMEPVGARRAATRAGRAPRRATPACRAWCRRRSSSDLVAAEHQRVRPARDASAPSARPASSATSRASKPAPPQAGLGRLLVELGRRPPRTPRPAASSIARRVALCEASSSLHAVAAALRRSRSLHNLTIAKRGLLDRAAGDVDHRPAIVGEHPPGEGELGIDRLACRHSRSPAPG